MSFSERQAELVDTHRAIRERGLPHVLVGGWAVSAFQTRFTTDVDMVIPERSLEEYGSLLANLGYHKQFDEDVSNVYEGRIVRYEKSVGDDAVEFDALVDALRCRQTNAEWSYRYLEEHSTVESLEVADDLSARIPEPALLFAIKLHSGRVVDARDLVIVGGEVDFDAVRSHLQRGDIDELATQIGRVLERIDSEGFEDSFKGVFQQRTLPTADIDDLVEFLRSLEETRGEGTSNK